MKKALLGSTALIAASLAVGDAAYAADGVKLGIGVRSHKFVASARKPTRVDSNSRETNSNTPRPLAVCHS